MIFFPPQSLQYIDNLILHPLYKKLHNPFDFDLTGVDCNLKYLYWKSYRTTVEPISNTE